MTPMVTAHVKFPMIADILSYGARLGSWIPTPTEAIRIRELADLQRVELQLIDAEKQSLQAMIDQLSRRRTQVENGLAVCKSLISPIRQIPPEILSEIFVRCLPMEEFVEPRGNSAPLLLCQICRSWREVAISTPALWCSMGVKGSMSGLEKRVPMMQLWLSRSGARRLSLKLYRTDRVGEQSGPDTFLRAIIPYARRWKKLCLSLSFASIKALLSESNPEIALPALETLDVIVRDEIRDSDDLEMSKSAVQLRHMNLCCSSLDLPPGRLDFGWAHLTRLELTTPMIENWWELLSRMPKLQYARLPIRATSHLSGVSRIILPELRVLKIVSMSSVDPLLDGLILPELRAVEFSSAKDFTYRCLASLVARSGCGLSRVIECEGPIREAEILEFAERVPSLYSYVALSPQDGYRSNHAPESVRSFLQARSNTVAILGHGSGTTA